MVNIDGHRAPKWDKVPNKGGRSRISRHLARERYPISSSFVCKSRFAAFDFDSGNDMTLGNSSKIIQNREKHCKSFNQQLQTWETMEEHS